jgi:hypothetical protein
MDTTYQAHLAHALSTLKWDLVDGWYTTCDILLDLEQTWLAAGVCEEDRIGLYHDIYRIIDERNAYQRFINSIEMGTVMGDF